MNEKEILDAIELISDKSKLYTILRYTEEKIEYTQGNYTHSTTEVSFLNYGDKPIIVDDSDNGEIPWLK